MEDDSKYYGGNFWESPSFMKVMIVCGVDSLFFISDPKEPGSTVLVEKDGKWLYTIPEIKNRLRGWTWFGNNY